MNAIQNKIATLGFKKKLKTFLALIVLIISGCLNPTFQQDITPTSGVKDVYDAEEKLKSNQPLVDDWKRLATSANCAVNERNISNALAFKAKIDFKNDTIQCEFGNTFHDMKTSLAQIKPRGLNEAYFRLMEECSSLLISDYNKVLKGGGSNLFPSLIIKDTCSDCNIAYAFHTFCDPAVHQEPNAYGVAFGIIFVDQLCFVQRPKGICSKELGLKELKVPCQKSNPLRAYFINYPAIHHVRSGTKTFFWIELFRLKSSRNPLRRNRQLNINIHRYYLK
jgi:hypothetical protein